MVYDPLHHVNRDQRNQQYLAIFLDCLYQTLLSLIFFNKDFIHSFIHSFIHDKTIIPHALVGKEMIIANTKLRASKYSYHIVLYRTRIIDYL